MDYYELLLARGLASNGEGGGGTEPTGSISITENGTYDVTTKAAANVNVKFVDQTLFTLTVVNNTSNTISDLFLWNLVQVKDYSGVDTVVMSTLGNVGANSTAVIKVYGSGANEDWGVDNRVALRSSALYEVSFEDLVNCGDGGSNHTLYPDSPSIKEASATVNIIRKVE